MSLFYGVIVGVMVLRNTWLLCPFQDENPDLLQSPSLFICQKWQMSKCVKNYYVSEEIVNNESLISVSLYFLISFQDSLYNCQGRRK